MQTSSKKLAPDEKNTLESQLATVLSDLKEPHAIELFLKAFLSPTEYLVFAKRLAILHGLHTGQSYQEIKHNLRVSSATIASTSELLQDTTVQHVMSLLDRDQSLRRWVDKLLGEA